MRLIGCEWKWREPWSDAVLIGRGLSLDFMKARPWREPSGLLLYSFERTDSQRFSGDSCEDTPVPMPNTVVKLTNAESTWLEAAREDRKLLIKCEKDICKDVFFAFHAFDSLRRFWLESPGGTSC